LKAPTELQFIKIYRRLQQSGESVPTPLWSCRRRHTKCLS